MIFLRAPSQKCMYSYIYIRPAFSMCMKSQGSTLELHSHSDELQTKIRAHSLASTSSSITEMVIEQIVKGRFYLRLFEHSVWIRLVSTNS